jgi:hypothetical protein
MDAKLTKYMPVKFNSFRQAGVLKAEDLGEIFVEAYPRQHSPDLGFVRDRRTGCQHDAPSTGLEIREHKLDPRNDLDGLPLHHGHIRGGIVFHHCVAPIEENRHILFGFHKQIKRANFQTKICLEV